MKRIMLKETDSFIYPLDVERMVQVAEERGYNLTRDQAEAIWIEHSERSSAGWLILPSDDDMLWCYMSNIIDDLYMEEEI